MGSQTAVFEFYTYSCGRRCEHTILVRVNRPAYPNADQGAEDAAEAFATSAADHLRTWWERWLLPRDCRRQHECVQWDTAVTDTMSPELDGPGLRHLTVWLADDGEDLVLGAAATEPEFWQTWNTYVGGEHEPRPRSVATHDVYFLTEQDGQQDLRDA